jgi:transposase
MSHILTYVGSDVSKAWLDLYVHPLGRRRRCANTEDGIAEMIAWLAGLGPIARIGLEASGGYEKKAAERLTEAGFPVALLDPVRVRRFAQASGLKAKNDAIDARLIAVFVATFETGIKVLDEERDQLAELCRQRAVLIEAKIRIANAGLHRRMPLVRRLEGGVIAKIETAIKTLERAIAGHLAQIPRFARLDALLRSVPGVGALTAATLIASLPELGRLSDKQIAALAGVAPYDRDSGDHHRQRSIAGGRFEVRRALYMAALAGATRHNPWMKAFYTRLRQRGKPAKVALTACMRKLVCLLNQIVARGYGWQPALPKP